jgi:ABC-type transport system involved in cytochrome c biogenesis permease component
LKRTFEDGSLEQEFLKEKDFYKLVISKIFVYVCLIGIPIALIGALFSFANGVAIGSFGKVFLLLGLSNLLLFNLFAFGNALSINKGSSVRSAFLFAASITSYYFAWTSNKKHSIWRWFF